MRSGQIQLAISNGVTPFALCHLVSKKIRTKRGDHIQDSIGAVFHALDRDTLEFRQPVRAEATVAVVEAA